MERPGKKTTGVRAAAMGRGVLLGGGGGGGGAFVLYLFCSVEDAEIFDISSSPKRCCIFIPAVFDSAKARTGFRTLDEAILEKAPKPGVTRIDERRL